MFGIVYLLTNTKNGKVYVGQTTRTLDRRWKSHLSSANGHSQIVIHRAIRKYGPDAFGRTVLAEAESAQELDALEIQFISQYGSQDPKVGYNRASGGNNPRVGSKHSEESKAKLRAAWVARKARGDYYKFTATDTAKGVSAAGKKNKQRWQNPKIRADLQQAQSAGWTPELRSAQAQKLQKQKFKDPTMSRRGGICGAATRWGKVN